MRAATVFEEVVTVFLTAETVGRFIAVISLLAVLVLGLGGDPAGDGVKGGGEEPLGGLVACGFWRIERIRRRVGER